MGVTESTVAIAPAITTKVPNCAVLADPAVVKTLSVAAGILKLNMGFDLLCNGGWILTKLTTDAFEGLFLKKTLFNDNSFGLS